MQPPARQRILVVDDDPRMRKLLARFLGSEGFETVLRLGGTGLSELKRIVFQRPPRDD